MSRSFLLLALALAVPQPAAAADPPARVVVVRASRVHDGSGRSFSPGEILVENGVVKELGTDVHAPKDAEAMDLGTAVITPWLVDPIVAVDLGRMEAGRPESALLLASDAVPAHDPVIAELRRRGVGAVGLVPAGGAGLLGRSSSLGTDSKPQSGAPILKEASALCFALPEDIAGSASRAAARSGVSQVLEDAETARRKKKEAKESGKPREGRRVRRDRPGGPSPASSVAQDEPNPALDVVLDAVDKKLPLLVTLQRADDALAMLALAETRGIAVTIAGCRGCASVAAELGRSQAIVVLDPLHAPASARNGLAGDASLVSDLAASGTRLSVTGGGAWPEGPQALRAAAAALASQGASDDDAIAAMTGRSAEAAGIEDRIGLAKGRPASFLAWSGSPLDATSHVVRELQPADFQAAKEPAP